jgi:hypothetical protein
VSREPYRVYIFDPKFATNPLFFGLAGGRFDDFTEFYRANKPIPADYFPGPLIVDEPLQDPPDIFRASSRVIVFSERARAFMERMAPGQVEFIPAKIQVDPETALQSNLDSAYYYANVLGRAQRFEWPEMPTRPLPFSEDGIQRFGLVADYSQWKLRQRTSGDPLIWRESWWWFNNREYRGHLEVLIEDILWHEIEAEFNNSLNAILVGAPTRSP